MTCDGVPCLIEPAELLNGGVETEELNFTVRPQRSGTLTIFATMTHVESGETHTVTSTSVVRDPERLELTCSYTDYDANVVQQPCATIGAYGVNGFFELRVMGVLGEERLVVLPTWTTFGFKDAEALSTDSYQVLHASGPGVHSARVTYGAFSAEYAVVLH